MNLEFIFLGCYLSSLGFPRWAAGRVGRRVQIISADVVQCVAQAAAHRAAVVPARRRKTEESRANGQQ